MMTLREGRLRAVSDDSEAVGQVQVQRLSKEFEASQHLVQIRPVSDSDIERPWSGGQGDSGSEAESEQDGRIDDVFQGSGRAPSRGIFKPGISEQNLYIQAREVAAGSERTLHETRRRGGLGQRGRHPFGCRQRRGFYLWFL